MGYEELICDANNLYKAYLASIRGSKWKESTQRFMMNYLRNIFSIQEDLTNRTLKNGKVEEFSLSERGRVRPITSIQIRDRIVRHVLCDEVLIPKVRQHVIYDNCASLKGRGISHQRDRFEVHLRKYYRQHGNEGWILFGDFSKFYDNIIHEVAKQELLKLFDNDEIPYENVENMFRGWMGSHYKLLSRIQRKNLMKLYEDLFDKTITVANKKLVISDRSPQENL